MISRETVKPIPPSTSTPAMSAQLSCGLRWAMDKREVSQAPPTAGMPSLVLAAIFGQVCRSATASARPVSSSCQEPLTDIGRTTNFDIRRR